MSDTNLQKAREFLFEWIGVGHRNDCRGSSIDARTGQCDACKRRVQPPLKMVEALALVFAAGDEEAERARIIAWLRLFTGPTLATMRDIADALEAGQHRTPCAPVVASTAEPVRPLADETTERD